MIMTCSCQHAAQDMYHGKGYRVHNIAGKGTKIRCTVCGNEKPLTAKQTKEIRETK